MRVLLIAGSDRRLNNCPGADSKAKALMLRLQKAMPAEWEVDTQDLGNQFGKPRIQSCNACVSTAMALCVWPCNCYEKNNRDEPDLMWDLDMYERLERADAWAIIGPVNWYAPSSNLKLMFDRLVCASGGNPREDLIDHKNPERARDLEHSARWEELSRNHLEGRTSAFFCYGDGGGDELRADGRPKKLRHPEYFNPEKEPFAEMREAYAPLVWQCRYSGIEVPDALWSYHEFGHDKKYSDNQARDIDAETYRAFDDWGRRFVDYVGPKGKVPPAKYSAIGYEPPGHRWADMKLKWRQLRIRAGVPPKDSVGVF